MKLPVVALWLSALLHSTLTTSITILLPLYIYPGTSAWNPVYSAVQAYPNVKFQIIINPDSGPGSTTYPDAPTRTGIAKLNSYPNVQTIGYVHTLYTETDPYTSYSKVIANVTKYANWINYSGANITVQGIFFDEVLATANSAAYTYYKNATTYAYNTIPSSITPVVLNPGVLASTASKTNYFNIADTIVEFENNYTNYKSPATAQSTSPYQGQSALLCYSTPTSANLTNLVAVMKQNGIEATYFDSDANYQSLSLLTPLAKAVAAVS